MAQLFTLYFPKYYFDLQKEFTEEFNLPLPFEYAVDDGNCYVSAVHYAQDNEGDPHYWHKKGLQPGLRIIGINDHSLIEDYNKTDDDGHFNPDTVLNEDKIEDILAEGDTEKFIFKFREEVTPEDHSIPLGLGYMDTNLQKTDDSNDKSERNPSLRIKMPDTQSNAFNKIAQILDGQIGASSFEKGFEPSQCRLNNPNSYWQPSKSDQTTLDTWLRIDLGMKSMITKLYMQGSQDHVSGHIKSFWIDYSDDCCQWKSHPLGEIKCKYKNHSIKGDADKLFLQNTNQDVFFAKVSIWPAISARFIRIRPYDIQNKVALRMELFGFKDTLVTAANLSFARVVTLDDINLNDKQTLMQRVTNLPPETKVIQVDCKAVISAALDRAGLTSVGFLQADDDNFICVFTTPGAELSERVLDELADVGVGREMGVISTTSIAFRNEPQFSHNDELVKAKKKVPKQSTFSDSVKSRMIVKQVVERIMNSSAFTFDYVCMLVVASLIAVGGLATDNSVIVVASMLVSPLMGPVLAFTFGVTLKEVNMAKIGLQNELLSLIICVITGFITGFFYALLSRNINDWPTGQMSSRGTPEGLADGAFIAAASGVGVALSVLGDYLSTVVGVAISASLLPPAVNCGMLFAFSIIRMMYPEWIPDPYEHTVNDYISMGGWSLLLTIENIIIIFAVSRFMFWIKNVYITKDRNEKVWKSVTNFRRNYHKLTSLRESTIRNFKDGSVTGGNTTLSPSTDEKIRQSMRDVMSYDFSAHGTLKGGVMNFQRQTSIRNRVSKKNVYTPNLSTPSEEVVNGSDLHIKTMEHQRISTQSVSKKQKSKSKTIADDSDSSGSEQSEEKNDHKPQRSYVAVDDLFTPDAVKTIKTPVSLGLDKEMDYDKILGNTQPNGSVELETINANEEAVNVDDGKIRASSVSMSKQQLIQN